MGENTDVKYIGVVEQVKAIKNNDEKLLETIYLANFSKVESFVLANNGDAEQARDIYQEAFIALWRNIQADKFHPENETAIDGYLYQIAKNKWLDYLRSGHYTKLVRLQETTPEESTAEVKEESEDLHIIKKHFKELGDNCRKVLSLFYYNNHSLKKIAAKMGWTEETARNNKYRCLQKLREAVNKNRSELGK